MTWRSTIKREVDLDEALRRACPEGRSGLFRQHFGINFGRCVAKPGDWRTHRDLRHRVISELESMEYRAETGASLAGEACADARVPCD